MGAYNAILDTLVTEAPKIRRNPAESGGSWTILLRFTMSASLAKSSSLISQFGSIPKKLVRLPKFIGGVVQQENELHYHKYWLRYCM